MNVLVTTSSAPARSKLALCRTSGTLAFTLVEIVIAIGIMSFAILAIISLFSVGLQSSRESSEDTHLALMTLYVNAWSRSQVFTNLATASNNISADPLPTFFFNAAGEVARNANGEPVPTAAVDSHYACTITWQTSSVSTNLIFLQYRFDWPLAAPATGRQRRVIVTGRANGE